MKILLVNSQFPTRQGMWLIEESKSFIKDMNADVLVYPYKKRVPYGEMKDACGIKDYNILIFNPFFNFLQEFNTKVDGISFNNKSTYDYLLTTETDFDISRYDAVYHIFYSRYLEFNDHYKFPLSKQFIHLYPMKYILSNDLSRVSKEVNLVTTQKYITTMMKNRGYDNICEVLGGVFLQKDSTFTQRQINNGKLRVSFSTLKPHVEKGGDIYVQVAEKYKKLYPTDNIEFTAVAACPRSEHITPHSKMFMDDLNLFYDTIDVYVSPHRGGIENGWPLGVEPMLRGCVGISTDNNKSTRHYPFSKNMFLVNKDDVDAIVKNIKKLYSDRSLLKEMSNKLQKEVHDFYSYENQQQKIFDYIKKVVGNV